MAIDLAVVPVAGRGTRMLPLTKSQPKEMLPVGQKAVVQYVAEELEHCGIRRLAFVTGPGKTAIENHFDIDEGLISHLREGGHEDLLERLEFERKDLVYFYTRQRRQLGLGHAIMCAQPVVAREPFVVALGDSIIGVHAQSRIVKTIIDVFEAEQASAVIAFEEVPREEVVHYGIARPGAAGNGFFELAGIIEKPNPDDAPSQLAVAARYVFGYEIFEYLHRTTAGTGDEIQLTDAIAAMIADGRRVLGVSLPSHEQRYDIGNFPSYFRAFFEFALQDPQYGEELRRYATERLAAGTADPA